MEKERHWIFTFGGNHSHPNGYVKIWGTFHDARTEMFRRYGDKWAMQYETEEQAGVNRFNLSEVI